MTERRGKTHCSRVPASRALALTGGLLKKGERKWAEGVSGREVHPGRCGWGVGRGAGVLERMFRVRPASWVTCGGLSVDTAQMRAHTSGKESEFILWGVHAECETDPLLSSESVQAGSESSGALSVY